MNLEIVSLLIGFAFGGSLIWLINIVLNKNKINTYEKEIAIESEKSKNLSFSLSQAESIIKEFNIEKNSTNEQLNTLKAKNEFLETANSKYELNLNELQKKIESQNTELTAQNGQLHQLKAQNDSLTEKLTTLKKEIDENRKLFENEFKNIAQNIIDEKSKKFTELNKENIGNILKPLSENIESFKNKVEQTYDKESKERFSLGEKVKELIELNQKLSKEANDLTKALKGDTKRQGDWGEMILERILEKSGLEKGREYFIQQSLNDESGNAQRPDVILKYPDNRNVIIDSKVSLIDYDKYANAETAEQQQLHLKNHIRSIRTHVDLLSQKNYHELVSSLDFTMMFIPIEPAYLEAVKKDEELWNYAYKKRVLLVCPTHLVSVIKIIADLWKREYQNKNALEIAKRGGLLYDKFANFIENLKNIGKNIENAGKSYDEAFKQLSTGKGNLLTQSLELKKLGIKSNKEINEEPELFLENDLIENSEN
ncbi:MAG: DNA recombination protein RmuC [Bacteroidetes bacterium]|nr:DNA recombination protein RmuC [Bacteroidota bacterium]